MKSTGVSVKNLRMANVLKLDRMSFRDLSLRDKKIGKVWFWTRNNCQKSITLPNSRTLYMTNENILFFNFLEIVYVSKMAIPKCPSVMSRRDTFSQDIKIYFLSGNFGSMNEV